MRVTVDREIINDKYMARITVNKANDRKFFIYGDLVDIETNEVIKSVKKMRRTARSWEKVSRKKQQLLYALANRARGLASTKSVGKRTKTTECDEIDQYVQELLEKKISFNTNWGDRTHRATYTYWINHGFSSLIRTVADSEDPGEVIRKYRSELISDTKKHGRSHGKEERVIQTVDTALKRMSELYKYLREIHPTLPDVKLSSACTPGRSIPEEQIKTIPDDVFYPYVSFLEDSVTTDPKNVFSAVIMTGGGTRTAETVAVLPKEIQFYDRYCVVPIICQEEKGVRVPRLKTDNSYRLLVLSNWATEILKNCIKEMGLPNDYDLPLMSANELSAWIRNALTRFGPSFMNRAEKIEATNPDRDEKGNTIYDVSAYVLRRNAASRWLNVDGLSHDEVDMLLGHKSKRLNPVLFLSTEEDQREIAQKLERFVYSPHFSAHPALSPVELRDGSELEIIPYSEMTFKNVTDHPMRIRIDCAAVIPGESAWITMPEEACENISARSIPRKVNGRTVIGDNQFERNNMIRRILDEKGKRE